MTSIASIVEGHGEVAAIPILLRRINEWYEPSIFVNALLPIRVHRDRFLNREDEFRRHVLLAASKCGADGWIIVLLDADDDCPALLGASILQRAQVYAPHRNISVVLANREFEAWFIAAAPSLDGFRGFVFESADAKAAEDLRDAKGWLAEHMAGKTYGETTDQPAFAARMDLQQAYNGSRSFRKFCDEWRMQRMKADRRPADRVGK